MMFKSQDASAAVPTSPLTENEYTRKTKGRVLVQRKAGVRGELSDAEVTFALPLPSLKRRSLKML